MNKITILFVTALFLSFQLAVAQLAEVDISFGENGFIQQNMVNSNGNNLESELSSLILQPDGKIVSASNFHLHGTQNRYLLHQYNSEGVLNTSFGTGGFIQSGINQIVKAVKTQSDGKFIISGYERTNMPNSNYIIRFNTNGTVDETFFSDNPVIDYIGNTALEIQQDDKILITQVTGVIGSRISKLIRYNADGSRDTTFGNNSEVIASVGSWQLIPSIIVVQSDGKIVLAGDTGGDTNIDIGIIRYNSNGSLDTTFDDDGIKIFDFASWDGLMGLVVSEEGKIVFGIYNSLPNNQHTLRMIRLNSDGNLDSSFGNGGTQDVSALFSNICNLKILESGKIVVSGTYQVTPNPTPDTDANPFGSVVVLLETNGDLDVAFGDGGFLKTIFYGYRILNNKIVVQPDGKIVVGITYCESWFSSHPHTTLLRYNPEATLTVDESVWDNKFTVYPNPVNDGPLLVDFNLKEQSVVSISLYDCYGKKIANMIDKKRFGKGVNVQKVDLPHSLSQGIYFLMISDGKNTTTIKLIK